MKKKNASEVFHRRFEGALPRTRLHASRRCVRENGIFLRFLINSNYFPRLSPARCLASEAREDRDDGDGAIQETKNGSASCL